MVTSLLLAADCISTCMSIGVAVFNTYYKSYTFPAGFAALSPNIS
jgi:hypothetical protein